MGKINENACSCGNYETEILITDKNQFMVCSNPKCKAIRFKIGW